MHLRTSACVVVLCTDIRQKLERLNGLWEAVQQAARTRGQSLESALAVAERFWEELNAVMRALRDLQENLDSQEPPAVEPQAIHQQQEVRLRGAAWASLIHHINGIALT